MMTFIAEPRWWLLVLLALGVAAPTQAQEAPPMLVVTVRDQAGIGVADVQVVVHDSSGEVVFGRAVTDSVGMAQIATLPTTDVRVAVAGTLPGGVPLQLSNADQHGIAITLTPPTTVLDLRVAPDGVVIPDPATMISLDSGVPIDQVIPTAMPALSLTSIAAPTTEVTPTRVPVVAPDVERISPGWLIYALAAVLVMAAIGLLVLTARWREG